MFFLMYPWYHLLTMVLPQYFWCMECTILLCFYAEWGYVKTYLKKCVFNYASNLTPDFKEALHEKRKDQGYHNRRGKRKQVSVVLRSTTQMRLSVLVTFNHILQQKDISRRIFPHNTSPNVFNVVYFWIPSDFLTKVLQLPYNPFQYIQWYHLADSFIQSEQHCFAGACYQFKHSLGTETMTLALLSHHALQQGYSVKVSRDPVSISPSQYYIRTIFWNSYTFPTKLTSNFKVLVGFPCHLQIISQLWMNDAFI